ncbi:MAG TPA: tetratricopeptide repeat protein, partial [Verrucomicrobiae bacterium]|nr:tetratricopeptide repeat protein [Verrucomicrobiae bacterium]
APVPPPPPATPVMPVNPPPLFRRIDWITLLVTTLLVFIGYYLTLAPDVTLEDSGELATGSFYAGIPHPPGYPVWSVYTYFWTLLPFGSVAWRVALGEAFSGAVACGLLAFIVSRGSSMMIEGIPLLKDIERKWENTICIVAGFVTGILMGYDGFMWSQSVIVEVYSFSVLSFIGTILCLLRWVYAPHQRRYLYLAFFLFGICFTNHQTLICATVGIEVAILAVDRRIGRDLFMGNTLVFLAIMVLIQFGMISSLSGNPSLYLMFQIVGWASAATFIWLTVTTRKTANDWIALGRDVLLLGCFGYLLALILWASEFLAPLDTHSGTFTLVHAVGILLIGGCAWLTWIGPKKQDNSLFGKAYIPLLALSALFIFALMGLSGEDSMRWIKSSLGSFWAFMLPGIVIVAVTFWLSTRRRELGSDIKVGVVLGVMWVLGASFYFYMAVSGMTCPPMQWGYPRTVEGFFHALQRGQYGATIAVNPIRWEFIPKVWSVVQSIADEFSWIYVLIAIVPFFFFKRMQKRERAWVIGLTAIYLSLAILLLIMLDPQTDRQSRELTRVFFTSSHVVVAMFVGYGITLLMASLIAARDGVRRWLPMATLAFSVMAIETVVTAVFDMYGNDLNSDGIKPVIYGFVFLGAAGLFWWRHGIEKVSNLVVTIGLALVGVSLACYGMWLSAQTHPQLMGSIKAIFHGLGEKLQHGDATWQIYGALWLAVMVGFVLVLAWTGKNKMRIGWVLGAMTLMPLYSVMSHWSDNEERGHWFGYYFGHDMFTPPFTAPDGSLSYDPKLREQAMKGPNASLVYPEMTRNAILFGGTDPGRFCPTYMIFCESFTPPSCKPLDPLFDRRDVYIITQNALADGTYLEYIRSQYFRSAQIDPPFFSELVRTDRERKDDYTNYISQAAYTLLDKPFEAFGARVEARRRAEGVYPPKEIYEPSPEDSQRCFNDYYSDVMKRYAHDREFPNEPRQMKPGEGADLSPDGKLQISGQVSVMAINGLLTKVIFDHNPTNEFFVEESFPLDWMYPNLTPFGVIMKINRDPLPELSDEICQRDHEFWSKYSERLIGNWITYDTPIKDICDFAERVYLRRDFTGFTGDRTFIRDDQAQKAFSKLRSSIAGIYAYRVNDPNNHDPKVQQRMIKEADFAFKQSFAYCPYSPEAVYRYINLLAQVNRLGDALLVAQTCLKLDPGNGAINDVVKNLQRAVGQPTGSESPAMLQLEQQVKDNPTNMDATFHLAQAYLQMNQQDKAFDLLDNVLKLPNASAYAVRSVVSAYAQLGKPDRLEHALERLTQVDPGIPEGWYDLAALKVGFGKNSESLTALGHALTLSDSRLAADPNQRNLRTEVANDKRFDGLRTDPQFQKIVSTK